MAKYRLTIWHDEDAESPEYETFEVQSFNTRHGNFVDPDNVDTEELETGFAFILSYFEHGMCQWSLNADGIDPMLAGDWQWDGRSMAGIVRMAGTDASSIAWWEGLSMDARKEVMRDFLKSYTNWSNGYVHGFTWEELGTCDMGHAHTTELLDSCGGFIGDDIEYGVREYGMPADATAENTEIVDPYGVLAYSDIWKVAA